jgi:hypothetical protein
MKIELKKISYNAKLSQETSAYFAEVWIDGVKRGTTQNDGHGGGDHIQPRSLELEINEYAKTLPPLAGVEMELTQDAELIFGRLLEEHLSAKQLKRLMSKKTVSIADGKTWTGEPKPSAVVLNSLPFEQALELFLATS